MEIEKNCSNSRACKISCVEEATLSKIQEENLLSTVPNFCSTNQQVLDYIFAFFKNELILNIDFNII